MELALTMRCPKCGNEMYSVANLFGNDFNEFDLEEFEGMDFKCKCEYKVHISAINPRDETGSYIY